MLVQHPPLPRSLPPKDALETLAQEHPSEPLQTPSAERRTAVLGSPEAKHVSRQGRVTREHYLVQEPRYRKVKGPKDLVQLSPLAIDGFSLVVTQGILKLGGAAGQVR